MTALHRLLSTFRRWIRPGREERQLDDELTSFVEMSTARRIRDGAAADEARRDALLEMGGVGQVKERVRDARAGAWLDHVVRDVGYGLRMLNRNRGFAATAIMSIGTGVGVTAAIFSFADALLLRPLPVPRPGQLYVMGTSDAVQGLGGSLSASYRDYLDVRDETTSFSGLAAHGPVSAAFSLSAAVSPRMILGQIVTGNFFDVLGATLVLGRGFLPIEDTVPGRDAVVVLGYEFWRDEFAGRPDIVGGRILLRGQWFTVVGVAPAGLSVSRYAQSAFYVPMAMAPLLLDTSRVLEARDFRVLDIRGRLRPGATLAQARAELDVLGESLGREYPATNANRSLVARSDLADRTAADPITATLVLMLGGLALAVLVVACANVAGLLESRAPVRGREIAMRLAIGASRGRVVRQLITETLLIALAGGALGVGMAYLGVRFFRLIPPPTDIPLTMTFSVDNRVLMVSLFAAVASAILSGAAPAWRSARGSLSLAMRPAATGTARPRQWRQAVLVTGQVALAVALLVVALAVHQAFSRELLRGPGYRVDQLVMMRLNPGLVQYDQARAIVFFDQLLDRTRAMSGVRSATLTSRIPMGFTGGGASIVPEGFQLPPGADRVDLIAAHVDEGYFDTMATPLVAGRAFRRTDGPDAPLVAIVNERAAGRYWPGGTAVGRRFRLGIDGPFVEVVGIARNTKYAWVAEPPTDIVYLSRRQRFRPELMFVVESFGDPAALATPLRELVHALDPNMPIADLRTMREFYDLRAAKAADVLVQTIAALGVMGLGLAIVGVYGLVAYAASRRTREIGIRMAVGADRGSVLRMMVRQGIRLAVVGLMVGLPAGLAVQRALQALFPAQTGLDPMPMLAVVPIVLAVTTLASYLPARRAASVDALNALRCE
jgi:putative ABC transport system permease protein